jgi:hypothetical protein
VRINDLLNFIIAIISMTATMLWPECRRNGPSEEARTLPANTGSGEKGMGQMIDQETCQKVLKVIKDKWLIALYIVFSIMALYLIVKLVFYLAIPIVSEPATDFLERVLDKALEVNITDYSLWYKTNIVLQGTLIVTALLATILASFTTKENADVLKKFSVFSPPQLLLSRQFNRRSIFVRILRYLYGQMPIFNY